jgi:hypothetical protein
MNTLIHTRHYELPGNPIDLAAEGAEHQENALKAVAHWKSAAAANLSFDTYFYNNVPVKFPFVLLNDSNNNPIWVISASYAFSDVGWRYADNSEVITDYCGHHGAVDPSFFVSRANVFQLVPALRERSGTNIAFVNNGCYNPGFFRWSIGGRLMIIPNDRVGAYGDNSGSFDLLVTVYEYLP